MSKKKKLFPQQYNHNARRTSFTKHQFMDAVVSVNDGLMGEMLYTCSVETGNVKENSIHLE